MQLKIFSDVLNSVSDLNTVPKLLNYVIARKDETNSLWMTASEGEQCLLYMINLLNGTVYWGNSE